MRSNVWREVRRPFASVNMSAVLWNLCETRCCRRERVYQSAKGDSCYGHEDGHWSPNPVLVALRSKSACVWRRKPFPPAGASTVNIWAGIGNWPPKALKRYFHFCGQHCKNIPGFQCSSFLGWIAENGVRRYWRKMSVNHKLSTCDLVSSCSVMVIVEVAKLKEVHVWLAWQQTGFIAYCSSEAEGTSGINQVCHTRSFWQQPSEIGMVRIVCSF